MYLKIVLFKIICIFNLGQLFVEAEPKLILVVRIKGICKIPHKAKKTMQLLGLNRIHTARFLAANKATISMLKAAEPYLTWGYPNLKCVRDLLYKRGHASINGQRIAISSNALIKRHLAQHDVFCIEDLIQEIFSVGEKFRYCNRFLSIFRLNTPKKGIVSKKRHFINGGDFGNREKFISDLVRKMM